MIDEKSARVIERVALAAEAPIGTVARVLKAFLSHEVGEPTEPWARLYFWEMRVHTAEDAADVAFAAEKRQAARTAIFAGQLRVQLDACYRRGKARGYSEGVVAGYDTARDIIVAEVAAAAEPVHVSNHRDVLRGEVIHG